MPSEPNRTHRTARALVAVERPRRSIRGKLDRLVVLSVGAALFVASVLSMWTEGVRYLESKREALWVTAQVFGAASSRAVAARDGPAVTQAIRAVARISGLVHAEVLDSDGQSLAEIGTAIRLGRDLSLDEAGGGSLLALLASRTVGMSTAVIDGGEQVGSLRLVSDTSDLGGRFQAALLMPLAGSGVALLLGLALSHRLQRSITSPLVSLARAMEDVERTGSYSVGPAVETDDEVGLLATRFSSMIGEIGRATGQILAREDEIIARLSRAGEQRDDQTGQHVLRVAKVSRIIAGQLGLAPRLVDDLCRASPMHDVGKISIPDAILFKPGRLDAAEREIMERHAEAGHRVLAGSSAPLVQLAAEIALTHHERWDGKGYPRRLSGESIPLTGRITAVADVCDALLSVRPYKQPWTLETVRVHLAENAGSHFDPTCVRALLDRWEDLEAIYADRGGSADAAPVPVPVSA